MIVRMIRYKVKPDRVDENEQLVRAVYDELAQVRPAGVRYATFKLDDGQSFVHVVALEGAENPLEQIAAFGRFQRDVLDRCEEPPVFTTLNPVGSFGLLEEID